MSFRFRFSEKEIVDRLTRGQLLIEDPVNLFRNRHFDLVTLGELIDDTCRRDPLDFLSDRLHDAVAIKAAAKANAKTPVSRLVVGAGQNEITYARKTHQRLRFSTEGGA